MELILLGIYSYIIWLIFFKFKWLPWNFVSQVIVVTIPIVGLTLLILILNIVAPSSADVRVVNYVVAINARVQRHRDRGARSSRIGPSSAARYCSSSTRVPSRSRCRASGRSSRRCRRSC